MAKIDVLNLKAEKVGELELSDVAFGSEVNEALLYEVVKAQLSSRRQGTASTKNRSAVRGSSKKVYKQKGTGNSRHGSIRAPSYVGGGQSHGPVPRNWTIRPPRKVRVGALRSALSMLFRDKNVVVVDSFALGEAKTKKTVSIVDTLCGGKKGLVVDVSTNENLARSIRNSAAHDYLPPEGVNVYDLLRHDKLVVTTEAVKALTDRCAE
jgi:large subunit ribosomal protein L4